MSTLAEQLRADLTTAMRDRDTVTTATLRMTLAALSTEAVAGKTARELTDDDIIRVLTREVRKRNEAADAYHTGGHADRADAELAEAAVLTRYLPTPLTDTELSALIADAIATTGATGPRGIGLVMKTIAAATAGRADGARVSAEVRRQLGA